MGRSLHTSPSRGTAASPRTETQVNDAIALEGGEKGETFPQPQKPPVGCHEPFSIHPLPLPKRFREPPGELQAFTGGNHPRLALALLSLTEGRHKSSKAHLCHTRGLQRRQRGWEEEQPLPARHTIHRILSIIIKTRHMYVDLVRGPRTKPATAALFNNPAVLTKTGLAGCHLHPARTSNTQSTAGRSRQQHTKRAGVLTAPAPSPGPAADSRRGACTSADEHVARAAGKSSGTCSSSRIYVWIWHLDHKQALRPAEQADPERLLNSTGSRSRGAGSANQYSTSEWHPSCNPTEGFSSTTKEDESVLPGPPCHYSRQHI